ncbi:MAG: hypothetical protein ACD_46C00533G0009 [uncultured bacterium]|nr:MAG: hypothetical protein ACD_46C00533G0009 [uncultured bacterium]
MKKEYSHRYAVKRSRAGSRNRFKLLISIAVIIFIGAVSFYVYRYYPEKLTMAGEYAKRLSAWAGEYRQHWRQKLVKVKELAQSNDAPPPEIHFEFYSALPNMQMNAADIVQDEKNQTRTKTIKKKKSGKSLAENTAIVDAEELENDISEQIQPAK